MNADALREISAQAFKTILLASGPVLLVSLFTGLLVSVFQAVTQIQEFTLTFVPKIIAVFVCLFVMAPWLTKVMVDYAHSLIYNIPNYVR